MGKDCTSDSNCEDVPSSEPIGYNTIEDEDCTAIKIENPMYVGVTSTNIITKDACCILENDNEQIPKYTDFVTENASENLTNHINIEGMIDTKEEILQECLPVVNAFTKIEITEHSLELGNLQVLEDIYRTYSENAVEDDRAVSKLLPRIIVKKNKLIKKTRNRKKKKVQTNTLDSFVLKQPVKETRNQKCNEIERNTIGGKVKKKINNRKFPSENFERLFIRLEKINISDKLHTISKSSSLKGSKERNKSNLNNIEIKKKSDVEDRTKLKVKKRRKKKRLSSIETVEKICVINKSESLRIEEMLLKSLNKMNSTSLTQKAGDISQDVLILNPGAEKNLENVSNLNKNKNHIIRIEPKVAPKKNDVSKFNYQCYDCQKYFQERQLLSRHIQRSHSKHKKKKEMPTEYQCHDCGKVVKHRKSIILHIRQHHTQGEEFHCDKCPYVTKLIQALRTHCRIHVPRDQKPTFKCRLCPCIRISKAGLQKHMDKIHHNIIKRKRCDLCDWEGDVDCLSAHVRIVHSDEEYFCYKCDFKTKNKGNLGIHLLTHNEHKEFSCPKCPFQTHLKAGLKSHLQRHGGGGFKKCPECPRMIKEVSFRSHVRTCHKFRPKTKCPQCGKEVFSLVKHLKTHNGGHEKHKCPECHFTCTNLSYMKLHIQKCHRESTDGIKKFICYHCDKESYIKADLIVHIKSVHEHNPCDCPVCGKKLKSRMYLASHLRRMHDKFKWYECQLCPRDNVYGTKHKHRLENHILQHASSDGAILYKCEYCPYETKVPEYLKQHVVRGHRKKSKKCEKDPIYTI